MTIRPPARVSSSQSNGTEREWDVHLPEGISAGSRRAWFYGITRGHGLKNVFTRMEQFRLARDPATCLALARRFTHRKIRNHRTMLMRLHLEPSAPVVAKLKTLAESALQAGSIATLLGTEGAAARFYFREFAGILSKDCTLAAMAVGLDPYIGFYHQPRFGRPALALDVMEEFRPLIAESAVLGAANNRMILPGTSCAPGRP